MNFLILSCKRATELIEKKLNFGLNPPERAQLFFHTRMCSACRTWEKQSEDLDNALKNHAHSNKTVESSPALDEEAKKSILRQIDEEEKQA
jgi:predicted anti-sigma-YlaC factor YlaD